MDARCVHGRQVKTKSLSKESSDETIWRTDIPMAVMGLLAATARSAEDYSSAYPPSGYCDSPDSPELIGREADAMSGILSKIDSPQRRDMLAEQWIRLSKRTIAKGLAFREEWLTLA